MNFALNIIPSILVETYQIEETNGVTGIPLTTPVVSGFSFNLKTYSGENNTNSSILWNFGDPFSGTDNEINQSNINVSNVTHTYTFPGNYNVTYIATINNKIYTKKLKVHIHPN